jgi:hypothetical protein
MGWRRDVKTIVLTAFGSKCGMCTYNKCNEALEFHHLDPSKKDFSISSFKFEEMHMVISELKKCACLCANCHREIHNGLIKLPDAIRRYDTRKSKSIKERCQIIYDKMVDKKQKRVISKKKNRYRNKNVV